jgi:hypothetical protein
MRTVYHLFSLHSFAGGVIVLLGVPVTSTRALDSNARSFAVPARREGDTSLNERQGKQRTDRLQSSIAW